MATGVNKARCVTCGKERAVMKCGGCSQDFCFNHMTDHRQELSKQMDEIEIARDLFRQTLTEQIPKPEKHGLMQQIDAWERDSITKIRQTADEARQLLLKHTARCFNEIEIKLTALTNQLRESRHENDFFETDLHHWKEELKRLETQLTKPSTIHLQHHTTPLINNISVLLRTGMSNRPTHCSRRSLFCKGNFHMDHYSYYPICLIEQTHRSLQLSIIPYPSE